MLCPFDLAASGPSFGNFLIYLNYGKNGSGGSGGNRTLVQNSSTKTFYERIMLFIRPQ